MNEKTGELRIGIKKKNQVEEKKENKIKQWQYNIKDLCLEKSKLLFDLEQGPQTYLFFFLNLNKEVLIDPEKE